MPLKRKSLLLVLILTLFFLGLGFLVLRPKSPELLMSIHTAGPATHNTTNGEYIIRIAVTNGSRLDRNFQVVRVERKNSDGSTSQAASWHTGYRSSLTPGMGTAFDIFLRDVPEPDYRACIEYWRSSGKFEGEFYDWIEKHPKLQRFVPKKAKQSVSSEWFRITDAATSHATNVPTAKSQTQ